MGGELLGISCVKAGLRYAQVCENFYDSAQCTLMYSSMNDACGREFVAKILSGKIICDALFPEMCTIEGKS